MPHEGYVDPITNDEPRFHSNVPISEHTERVARAIEASNVSLTPPIAETADGVMITKMRWPLDRTPTTRGAQGKLDSQGNQLCGHRTMARIVGRGYVQKLRIAFLKQKILSPTSFTIISSIFSETQPRQ